MAGQLKLRRGTTSQLANYIGSEGELTYDTALKSLVLHDGVTLGGVKIPYLSNDLVPSTMLPTATESVVGASKIATTEIAQGGANDTDFITALKLYGLQLGVGQSYKNVTANRILGTTYTNPSKRPIFINVLSTITSNQNLVFKITIGAFVYEERLTAFSGAVQGGTGWVMIPPLTQYKVENGASSAAIVVKNWLEVS